MTTKSIRVDEKVYDELVSLKHPGQSFTGLFIELLAKLAKTK